MLIIVSGARLLLPLLPTLSQTSRFIGCGNSETAFRRLRNCGSAERSGGQRSYSPIVAYGTAIEQIRDAHGIGKSICARRATPLGSVVYSYGSVQQDLPQKEPHHHPSLFLPMSSPAQRELPQKIRVSSLPQSSYRAAPRSAAAGHPYYIRKSLILVILPSNGQPRAAGSPAPEIDSSLPPLTGSPAQRELS